MKLAINYSAAARILCDEGAIRFDVWKCADKRSHREGTEDSALPRYVHFPLDAGDPAMAETEWDTLDRMRAETHTPYVNVHLNAQRLHFPELADAAPDTERRAVRDRFLRNLAFLSERYGAENVIAENVIYRGPEGKYLRASVEPETIREVIEAVGCGLLLDTAHARITCAYLQTDLGGYFAALPCHRLRELHITGVRSREGRLRDSMPMTVADGQIAESVLGRIGEGKWPAPWVVAWEYGGTGPNYEWRSDPAVIAVQFPRLAEQVSAATERLGRRE